MSFDWADFLKLAEILHGSLGTVSFARDEAALRSTVSRAYYSAFGLARRRLRDVEGFAVPASGAAHAAVARYFARAEDSDRKRIAGDLLVLRDWRNQCDYDDEVPDLPDVAAAALNLAREVAELLRRL